MFLYVFAWINNIGNFLQCMWTLKCYMLYWVKVEILRTHSSIDTLVPTIECLLWPWLACTGQGTPAICVTVSTVTGRPPPSSASKSSIRRFVITEKAHTRAFSWLKAATTIFTFKTLLRHYAKRTLTPRSINVKLSSRRNYHKGWAVWLV